ncbi:MAG TPA: aconitase family protein [Candidatus Eisenbacteria bacterium]
MARGGRGAKGPELAAIVADAFGRLPEAGEPIELPLDLAVLGGSAGPESARLALVANRSVWDPRKVALTVDFPAPNVESRVPRSRAVCREFAAHHGLRHVFDLNLGIGAQVLLEMGVVTPGLVVGGCGRCLHLMGAAGSFVVGAEPGVLAPALSTGKLSMRMPHLAQVEFIGPAGGLSAFDMGLMAARALEDLSADTNVQYTGRAVDALGMDGRITLVEVGADALRGGFIAADQVTQGFYKGRRDGGDLVTGRPDVNVAIPSRSVELSGAPLLVQGPGPGGPVRPLSDLAGKKIHSAFIGSCAAGRQADLMEAAGVVKRARRIHGDVRLTLAPATLEVARHAVTSGLYEIFINAGAMLAVSGSSPGMAGGGAVFGEGEIILSTVPYQSPMTDAGRGPEVYRASPLVVAAAAVAGEIRHPADLR